MHTPLPPSCPASQPALATVPWGAREIPVLGSGPNQAAPVGFRLGNISLAISRPPHIQLPEGVAPVLTSP